MRLRGIVRAGLGDTLSPKSYPSAQYFSVLSNPISPHARVGMIGHPMLHS